MTFINKPVPSQWTDDDVVSDFNKYQNKKKVAAIWGIGVKEVNDILKRNKG